MEKLPMDVVVEIASRVAATAADPMEDLGSLWATRWVRGDAIVGRSIPLRRVLLRGIQRGT
jgi:hypothetical protein